MHLLPKEGQFSRDHVNICLTFDQVRYKRWKTVEKVGSKPEPREEPHNQRK